MELLNASKMTAGYTQGVDKDGREYLVVAVKGTFILPFDGGEPMLAAEQLPLTEADEFTGEPGFSATLYETDYAPIKPRCDVLINATAYAPNGRATTSLEAGFKIGNLSKVINVVGNRFWYAGGGGIGITRPQSFESMPISYDYAFGGTDNFHPDENKKDAYLPNPVGRGFHRNLEGDLLHNTPLPNTEERGKSVSNPVGDYKPMAFGAMGRGWPERAKYAGTYDQKWVDDVFPFLPADFDKRYFQAAPADQQCDYLHGGEQVHLLNLTENGHVSFRVPTVNVPVVFFRKKDDNEYKQAVADTLLIEPDKGLFSITWRSSVALRKNMFEIPQVLVGNKSRGWWRARELGKTYHESLASVVATANGDDDDE